jgi:hypothetical protein
MQHTLLLAGALPSVSLMLAKSRCREAAQQTVRAKSVLRAPAERLVAPISKVPPAFGHPQIFVRFLRAIPFLRPAAQYVEDVHARKSPHGRSCTRPVRVGMHAIRHRSKSSMLHKLLDVITICGRFSSLVLDWASGFLSLFPIHNMDFDETALTPQRQGERGFVCTIDTDQPSRSAGDGVMAWCACLRSR